LTKEHIDLLLAIATVALSGLTISAIIYGPIRALQVQRKLDEEREARDRKLWVFKTLMSYRATGLAPQFVQALNIIELEFDRPEEKPITTAWKELLDHFQDMAQPNRNAETDAERRRELTAELLVRMGKSLGYDFDKVYIKKSAYYPQFLVDVETEQHLVRKGILSLLKGHSRLPVAMFEEKFPAITLAAEAVVPEPPRAVPIVEPRKATPKALEPHKADDHDQES